MLKTTHRVKLNKKLKNKQLEPTFSNYITYIKSIYMDSCWVLFLYSVDDKGCIYSSISIIFLE